jgi:hypothetical protein
MVHGQHGVRLAATEGGLKLDDRLATISDQPLGDLRQQQSHPLCDKGTIIERRGILVFFGRFSGMHCRDIRCELRLLKGSFQYVAVWNCYFSPRFHKFVSIVK